MATAARALPLSGKTARQRAILDLVRTRVVRTQEELVELLRRRRVDATQATVSRDIRELGLLRVHDHLGPRYTTPAAELDVEGAQRRLRSALGEHVQSIEFIDLLGILRAAPGTAPLVASALDAARFDEVAGTVAGDDTVLVVTRSRPAAQRLWLRLRAMSGEAR
ncbi:MAG: arginine repressor [Candidatus Dormibacteraeota bacterium]|nr:arginine repressor [Candidatus Dormibacteraeota bacterium]MBV9524845.1 arginine repressor [Candidatus Dormibacteraeota bacterium]